MRNLKDLALILAVICEKLEKLMIVSEDPRIAGGKKSEIQNAALSLVEIFLAYVQRTNQGTFTDRIRFHIPADYIEECLFKLHQATSEYAKRMDAI